MNIFKKLYGIVDNYLQLGVGSTAHGIADNANGVEAKENANGNRSNFITAQATLDEHCSNYLDLKQRIILLEFSFDGTTGIVGATAGQYGICHTTGGAYTAGDIYLATGATTGILVTVYKMQTVCNVTAFSGTVSMNSNSFYVANTGTAPYSWTITGDSSAKNDWYLVAGEQHTSANSWVTIGVKQIDPSKGNPVCSLECILETTNATYPCVARLYNLTDGAGVGGAPGEISETATVPTLNTLSITAGSTAGFPNSSKLYAFQIYMNGGTTPELVSCKNAVLIQS
jgi:hypothetical protein